MYASELWAKISLETFVTVAVKLCSSFVYGLVFSPIAKIEIVAQHTRFYLAYPYYRKRKFMFVLQDLVAHFKQVETVIFLALL